MIATQKTYLNLIGFSELESWSSYSLLGKKLLYTNNYPFVKIGNFLKRNKTQVKIEDDVLYKRPTIRINGKGITLRDEVFGKVIGTKNQFRIKSKQFLLSKIDARNGAFGVVSDNLNEGIITGNFWTFDVNYNLINPHYLSILTGTKEFQKLCQTASVGTTNRNYLQESLFLDFEIPLPSLQEQERIVTAYQTKIQEAETLEKEANDLEGEIEKYLSFTLGINKNENPNSKGFKTIKFSELSRWDGKEINEFSSKFPIVKASEVIQQISTGTTPPTNKIEYFEGGDINFYTPADLTNEKDLIHSERKVTELAIKEKKARQFFKDTLLFVGIGSTVGKVGIVKNEIATSNQQITGIVFNNKIDINFAYFYFEYFKDITTKEKTQATIPIVNQDKILNIPIPLPPIEIQLKIVNHINEIKDKIKSKKEAFELKLGIAIKDFEQEIFGTI